MVGNFVKIFSNSLTLKNRDVMMANSSGNRSLSLFGKDKS
jgi:hypothetical protein